ncbi:MAG TPA: sugar phosphate isomerase/epimerase [Patescibacteria group bacterium]|nr:sugar phosphate isomerase/epimerase [Patescibacteria group bacterium]
MKLAVSNLALPARNHAHLLPRLRQMGLTGLEVAPDHTWADSASSREVTAYRYAAENAYLDIVGLDMLLANRPEFSLLAGRETAHRTADELVRLSALCRDLGGRSLILGNGLDRGSLPLDTAWIECRNFLEALLPRIEDHGTVLCFAPRAPADFCGTARECRLLADYFQHPSLGLHLNSLAQVENNDTGHSSFSAVRDRLDHVHANEPDLASLGSTGRIDHADFRRHLASVSYRKWVVLKQRAATDPLDGLSRSAASFCELYLREDNQSLQRNRANVDARPHL